MAFRSFVTPQDVVDAMSETTYMALFDDGNSGNRDVVDKSQAVLSVIARAHAQVMSFLPTIYKTTPPEIPVGVVLGGDNIPVLLKDAELQWAIIYGYRRHKEYVKTYSAEPGGSLVKEAVELMKRIADAVQRIAPSDSPPEPKPETVGGSTSFDGARMAISNVDGTANSGDW